MATEANPQQQQRPNILYCTLCDSLLRTAVALPCCRSPCCEACANKAGATCGICGKAKPAELRHDPTLRKVAEEVSVRCPNEGCGMVMRYVELRPHREGTCKYEEVACVFAEEGCTHREGRQAMRDHQTQSCTYRMVSCPQRCGHVLPYRDTTLHIDIDCPRTLVMCPNRCGQDIQRGSVGEHDSVCPIRPRSCPYRQYGCEVHGTMTATQLEHHMAVSIHAHLLQLDNHMKKVNNTAVPTTSGPSEAFIGQGCTDGAAATALASRYDWDAGYVQNVGKWDAQHNTIRALGVLGPNWLVSGCDRGNLVVFDRNSGGRVKEVVGGAGVSGVRSLIGTADGRVYVGFADCSVQCWMSQLGGLSATPDGNGYLRQPADPLTTRIGQQMLIPTHRNKSKGVTKMALVRLPRAMLSLQPSLLLVEGRAAVGSSSVIGKLSAEEHCFEALVCLVDDYVAVLEEATLQVVTTIPITPPAYGKGYDKKQPAGDANDDAGGDDGNSASASVLHARVTCDAMTVIAGRWIICGCSNGALKCVDLYHTAASAATRSREEGTINHPSVTDITPHNIFTVANNTARAGVRFDDTAITAMAAVQFRTEVEVLSASRSSAPPNTLIAIGGNDGGILVVGLRLSHNAASLLKGRPYRCIPRAHKGPILCLTQVDGKHFASGGSDECWRLWGPVLGGGDDDEEPMQVPAVDLPSSMYTAVVADNGLYAAGGQGMVKEWVATALRYVRRPQ